MSNITCSWYKLHRPTTIDGYVFQNHADELKFKEYIDLQNFPDLMLMGHRGTGKTTLAYILKMACNVQDIDTLVLNASDENKVDDIRHLVKPFINSLSMGKFKLVILDEADALTMQAQEALKSMIDNAEDSELNARFILICNKPHKIIPELHSRTTGFNFTSMDKPSMKKIGLEVLQDHGMDFSAVDQAELLETIDAHLKFAYPDLRKFITSLEKGYTNGALVPPSYNERDLELLVSLIVSIEDGDWIGARDIIYEDLPTDDIGNVYRFLDTNLYEIGKFHGSDSLAAKAYTTLAHYAAQHEVVAIPELNLTACIIKLCELKG